MKKPRIPPHSHSEVQVPTGVESSQLDFLWKQHGYISDFVKFADTKAAFTSVAATALLGALFSFFLTRPSSLVTVLKGYFDLMFVIWSSVSLLMAVLLTVWAIIPRLNREAKPGPLSWIEVAHFESATAFTAASIAVTAPQAVELLSKQIWHMARICERKHLLVRWSIFFGLSGGVTFAFLMTHLLLFVIY
jgi:hypothetical protein